jgi:hypothetical protein
MGGFKKPKIAS